MTCDPFYDWFAGLMAGEGCFVIREEKRRNSRVFSCQLTVQLRDDDLPILLEIQTKLRMGVISRNERVGSWSPAGRWDVARIDDVIRLVGILDEHPLRGKKQADYEIWREAAFEISRGRGAGSCAPATYDKHYLSYLAQKLKMVRKYKPPEIEDYNSQGEQLELEWPLSWGGP